MVAVVAVMWPVWTSHRAVCGGGDCGGVAVCVVAVCDVVMW